MKNFFKKHFFLISFIFIFILIEIFQFITNYKESIKPPSSKWSKGVLLSQGTLQTNPKIMQIDEDYLVVHDNGNKLDFILIDKFGSKIKEKEISTKTNLIKGIFLSKNNDDIYVSWLNNNGSKNTLYSLKTNKNLEEKGLFVEENVFEALDMDNHYLLLAYDDKIERLDLVSKEKFNFSVNTPSFLSSCLTDKGSLITYKDKDNKWFYLISKDNELTSPKFIQETKLPTAIKLTNTCTNMDSNNGYVLIEYKIKGELDMLYLTFPFDGGNSKLENLQFKNSEALYNIMPYKSGTEVSYVASLPRYVASKSKQPNIVDFTIKNLNATNVNFISKTISASKLAYPYKDMVLYAEYVNQSNSNLYLSSSNEDFKLKNNSPRDSEKKLALSNTFYSLFKSISFIFTWGFAWIIFGCIMISSFSFFCFNLEDKTKKIFYISTYIITSILKIYFVYKFTYISYKSLLPQLLSNPIIGLFLCVVISILSLFWGYSRYKKDLDAIPASSFIIAILVDTIFTQMIFVPFVF